jgi:hypothetical protein
MLPLYRLGSNFAHTESSCNDADIFFVCKALAASLCGLWSRTALTTQFGATQLLAIPLQINKNASPLEEQMQLTTFIVFVVIVYTLYSETSRACNNRAVN